MTGSRSSENRVPQAGSPAELSFIYNLDSSRGKGTCRNPRRLTPLQSN